MSRASCRCALAAAPPPVLWVYLVVVGIMFATMLAAGQTFRGGIETVEVTFTVPDATYEASMWSA